MATSSRVFITGRSALTACGETADETWSSVMSGEHSLGEITQWDLSTWSHRLGGELKNYQPAKWLPDRKLIKVLSRQDVIGINAAMQAVEHSQLIAYRDGLSSADVFNDQTAVYVGSPGNKYFQQYDFLPLVAKSGADMRQFADHLFQEVHPMWLLRILPNNVLAYTGITYGFKGHNQNIANHAVSGTQAIIEAYHAIRQGQAERAVVVAYDVAAEPQALFYYQKLGVLSARHLKPFDEQHDGTLLAEGAAALVLESEESVRQRGATCYGEILGGLSASESMGLFSLDASGGPLAELVSRLLESAQLSTTDVDLLIAHGNGTPKSDLSEASAMGRVFGPHEVPVTSFKWAMGHTICASGVLDTVLTTYALGEKNIPGIGTLDKLASGCYGINATREHRPLVNGQHALLISRGFASINACLLIKSCV